MFCRGSDVRIAAAPVPARVSARDVRRRPISRRLSWADERTIRADDRQQQRRAQEGLVTGLYARVDAGLPITFNF